MYQVAKEILLETDQDEISDLLASHGKALCQCVLSLRAGLEDQSGLLLRVLDLCAHHNDAEWSLELKGWCSDGISSLRKVLHPGQARKKVDVLEPPPPKPVIDIKTVWPVPARPLAPGETPSPFIESFEYRVIYNFKGEEHNKSVWTKEVLSMDRITGTLTKNSWIILRDLLLSLHGVS